VEEEAAAAADPGGALDVEVGPGWGNMAVLAYDFAHA